MATGTLKAVLSKDEFDALGGLAVDISFVIPSSGWSNSAPYTYTWTNSAVTEGSHVDVGFNATVYTSTIPYIEFEKVSGGVQFTAPSKPIDNIPVVVHITHVPAESISADQTTFRKIPFGIATTDWTLTSGVYVAEIENQYITTTSSEFGFYDGSFADYAKAHIVLEKKSGGGGIKFTTAKIPTGTITGTLYVFDDNDGQIPVLMQDTVMPIKNGGTGQSTLAGAKSALGITTLAEQIAKNVTYNNGSIVLTPNTSNKTWITTVVTTPNSSGNITIDISALGLSSKPKACLITPNINNVEFVYLYDNSSASSVVLYAYANDSGSPITSATRFSIMICE